MKVFVDSSALVKRYVQEKGSEKVETLLSGADSVAVSVISLPEVISALSRMRRMNLLGRGQYEELKKAALADFEDLAVCGITPEVVSQTLRLLEVCSLKTMDALHIGCALEVGAEYFISADQRQIQAAKEVKLKTVLV